MTFILLAALMTVIAAACIAIPLWRNRSSTRLTVAEASETVYHKQLAELDRDLANGVLAKSDYQAAIRDLENERRANKPEIQTASPRPTRRRRLLAISSALIMILVAGTLYWQMGNWRVGAEGVDAASRLSIENMVQKLADRLHTTDQNDVQGWLMLGHAYVLMERYPDAIAALEHARKITNDQNAEVLSDYAEAVTLEDPDNFVQRAAPLFEKVLKLDPNNEKALWYGGLAASQQGDNKLAIARWQALLKQGLPEKYSSVITQYIEQAGGTVTPSSSGPRPATVIHVRVALSPSLKARVTPDETVFVFARPAGTRGGPPLAVHRLQVHDLPLDLTLSDQDAMIAGRSLSDFDTVELVARISKDGSPLPKAGEPSGSATWKRSDSSKSVEINIDTVVK